MAGAFEEFPAAVVNVLVERGGDHGGADVAGAAADEAGLRDFAQTVCIFEIGEAAQGLVLVGAPTVEVGLVAGTFGAAQAFGRVLVN